jgi:integral membrane protein
MKKFKLLVATKYDVLNDIFTDKEAWTLFKLVAFLETFGWTLLIVGILFSHYKWTGYAYVLPIAGSVHGVLYLFYLFIVLFTHRSMGWGIWRFVIAEAVSNLPFGALVFELFIAQNRRRKNLHN